jgi:hypothetical protein
MIKHISIIIGLIAFSTWKNMVENPSYMETGMGVVISILFGFFCYIIFTKLFIKNKNQN